MGRRLLGNLCGTEPRLWAEATRAAREALHARRALWDGVAAAVGDMPPRIVGAGA